MVRLWPVMRMPRSAESRSSLLSPIAVLRIWPPCVSPAASCIIGKGPSKGKTEDRGIGAVSVIALPAADRLGATGAIEPKRRLIVVRHLEKQPLRAASAQAL